MIEDFRQFNNEIDRQEYITTDKCSFAHSFSKDPTQLDVKAHKLYRHTSDRHQLLIFLSGECDFVTDNHTQRLQPGDVCFSPAFTYYHVNILGNAPYERCVIHITPDERFNALAKDTFEETANIVSVDLRKHLLPWIERYRSYSKILPIKQFSLLSEILLQELLYICLMQKVEASHTIDTAENILKNALVYIDANWARIKNIREISNALFISPSYMYEIFNKKIGVAPKTYLMQKRLRAAHAYLISGMQPNEVSQLVGFNTYTAFYRACKALYGKTPQEIWVKNDREKN